MVLAEEVTAKDDLPPFRASVMVTKYTLLYIYGQDGYAIKFEVAKPGTVLEVVKSKKGLAGTKSAELYAANV